MGREGCVGGDGREGGGEVTTAIPWPSTQQEYERWRDYSKIRGGVKGVLGPPKVLAQYQTDPLGFFEDILGIKKHTIQWSLNPGYEGITWDGTPDPLKAVCDALLEWQDVGVESGTGTGKSFLGALIVYWFCGCFPKSRVFTFANKEDQLRLYIWAEMADLWPRFKRHFPNAEMTDLRLRMDGTDKWGAWGYAVGKVAGAPVNPKAAGMHAKYMMLIYEEMQGAARQVVEAGENTVTAPYNVRVGFGNPDSQNDMLHEFCTLTTTAHVRASAYDHPNIRLKNPHFIEGAVSQQSIDRRIAKYGTVTHPLVQSRVRGVSPEQAHNALVHRSWLIRSAALKDDPKYRSGKPSLGSDVANSLDGDKAAIARGVGAWCFEVESFQCPDSNEHGRNIVKEMEEGGLEADNVGVDPGGVGAGTYNELKRAGYHPPYLNFSLTPFTEFDWQTFVEDELHVRDRTKFRIFRDQLAWRGREDIRLCNVVVPEDQELWEELTTVTYEDKNGVVHLQPGPKIIEQLGRSPDKMWAFFLWNWVRDRSVDFDPPEPEIPDDPTYDAHYHQVIEAKQGRTKNARGF